MVWSKKYEECVVCETTKYKHHAKGLCTKCRIQHDEVYKENSKRIEKTPKRLAEKREYKKRPEVMERNRIRLRKWRQQKAKERKLIITEKGVKNNMEKTKYMLNYGFRRYSCCKKLGWKTIPCFIKESGKTIELEIKDIVVPKGNTRIKEKSQDMIQLMLSIKQNGLLEPVGVIAEEKATEEDFLITNLIENLQRASPTPMEQARGIQRLQENGLSVGEIAVRMGLPSSRIANLIRLVEDMPKELEAMENVTQADRNKGKIGFSTLNLISNWRVSRAEKKRLLAYVKKNSLSVSDVKLILDLVIGGMDLTQAINSKNKYIASTIKVVLSKEVMSKNEIKKGNITQALNNILSGQRKAIKGLVYYDRE